MTSIEWTHGKGYVGRTWNPTVGCDKVSDGCTNCYAIRTAYRMAAMGRPEYQGLTVKRADGSMNWTGQVNMLHDRLNLPMTWSKPSMVFVDSMSDLFHEDVSIRFLAEVFFTMACTPQHIYQVLTKRPDRMAEVLDSWEFVSMIRHAKGGHVRWPLPNVWLGTSVEDQRVDHRIPRLLEAPAVIHFLSLEPLLGRLTLDPWLSVIRGIRTGARIDWIIIGGESGPGARPFDLSWARHLIMQARFANCEVFVKQLGAKPYSAAPLKLKDHKGGDWSEWPEDLRVREFPKVRDGAHA